MQNLKTLLLKRKTLAVLLLSGFIPAALALEASPNSQIIRFITFTSFGGGDVYVQLANNGAQCEDGYYLKKDHPGFEANYSLLLSAFVSGKSVKITGYDDRPKWPGSSRYVCEIYGVEMVR